MGRRPDVTVGNAAGIVIRSHDLTARVDGEDPGIGLAWRVDRHVEAAAKHESMLVPIRIDVEPYDLAAIVDSLGDGEQSIMGTRLSVV